MVWGALASTARAADCHWLAAATSTHSNYTTHLPNSQKLTETHRKGQEKLCYFNIRHCSSKSSACDLLTPLWGGVESTFPVRRRCVHHLLEESFKTVLPHTYFRFLCPKMWSLHPPVNHLKHRKDLAWNLKMFYFSSVRKLLITAKTHEFINTLNHYYEKQRSILYYIKHCNSPRLTLTWVELWKHVVSFVDAATNFTSGTCFLSSVLISAQVATARNLGLCSTA